MFIFSFWLRGIAADGSVLYDNRSDSGAMVNHLEQAEVQYALKTG